QQIQQFANVDWSEQMSIVGVINEDETSREQIVAMGNYYVLPEGDNVIFPPGSLAEVSILVLDQFQNRGIGKFLLDFLGQIAKSYGLRGFIAEVLIENTKTMHIIESSRFKVIRKMGDGIYEVKMTF
ncbi:unnamed protein product, partial [marine sediment metagenome]